MTFYSIRTSQNAEIEEVPDSVTFPDGRQAHQRRLGGMLTAVADRAGFYGPRSPFISGSRSSRRASTDANKTRVSVNMRRYVPSWKARERHSVDWLTNARRDLHIFQSATGKSLRCLGPSVRPSTTTYAIIRFRRVGVVTDRPTVGRRSGRPVALSNENSSLLLIRSLGGPVGGRKARSGVALADADNVFGHFVMSVVWRHPTTLRHGAY